MSQDTSSPVVPCVPHTGNKYHRQIFGLKQHGQHNQSVTVDIYSVLTAYAVTIPGLQHAAKKILCCGIRGKGDRLQDLREARDALTRAIEDIERELLPAPGEMSTEELDCIYFRHELSKLHRVYQDKRLSHDESLRRVIEVLDRLQSIHGLSGLIQLARSDNLPTKDGDQEYTIDSVRDVIIRSILADFNPAKGEDIPF